MRPSATEAGRPPTRRRRTDARRRRARRGEHRVRRFALLAVVAVVSVVTLALTAFGGSRSDRIAGLAPAPADRLLPTGSPQPVVIATLGALRLTPPVAVRRITAIGFHGGGGGALALEPVGRQGNEGLLARLGHRLFGDSRRGPVWYQLGGGEGPRTSGLDVGAAPGTAVYSPVDGRIVGLAPWIVDGRQYGNRIDVQPARSPSVVVSLTHVTAEPSLAVGATVTAAQTRLGAVTRLSQVETQSLARYTNDAGDHVAIEVHPAATLALS
jgi:murein DD-endopeptidase MepM/ murein hydrolase activator NlpD